MPDTSLFSVQKSRRALLATNVQSFSLDAFSVICDKSQVQRGSNQEISVTQWIKHSSCTWMSGDQSTLEKWVFVLLFKKESCKTEGENKQEC
jgi:hypothetical protein